MSELARIKNCGVEEKFWSFWEALEDYSEHVVEHWLHPIRYGPSFLAMLNNKQGVSCPINIISAYVINVILALKTFLYIAGKKNFKLRVHRQTKSMWMWLDMK